VVVGFYHHKSEEPLELGNVKKAAEKLGFRFPVAIHPNWQTLKRWWLNDEKRKWTSVSFLLDRKGVIRHVHPGGQYVAGDKAYEEMKAKIEELVKEK
jgi:peroxiredoxin